MKVEAVRKFHFSAGHRIYQHESECANLHGHNYTLWINAEAEQLDPLGRVLDFSFLKDRVHSWLQENWDHTMLIFIEDKEMLRLESFAPKNRPWFITSFNPTAENMAIFLLTEVCPRLFEGTGVVITKIELWETENCKVVVNLN